MKTEEEITKIVKEHGGSKMGVARHPTWLNKIKLEGFQIELGKLRPFWIKDEERIFGEAPSEVWQKVIDEVEGKNDDASKKTEQRKKEKTEINDVPQQNESTEIADRFLPAIVPDSITLPLMEKWKKMSTFERMLMFQKTSPENIEERKGFKKLDGTYEMLKYVKGNFMLQELNIAFLFDWSSVIEEVHETETGFWIRGYISVNIDGKIIKRSAIGTADKHKGVNSEDVAKAAAMDMLKKAASTLGFNSDVYRGDYDENRAPRNV